MSARRDDALPPARAGVLATALLALAALYALARMGLEPPAPKPASAPPHEFSAERAQAELSALIADGAPHPAGTPAHARVRGQILAVLARDGYEPAVQDTLVRGKNGVIARVQNIVARRAGTSDLPAVMLAAHYDSVGAGPGAGDDGAGVAALLEIARALALEPPTRRPVIFLVDDAEELGLLGAQAFVGEHPWAKEVGLVVNLEARGTSGASMMFETSEPNLDLMNVFARAVKRPVAISAAYEIYKRMPNDTDLTVFKAHGMRGFNFAFIGGVHRYHTPRDDLAHLSAASVQHHGDNALALVRALAADDLGDAAGSARAVYADVFSAAMIVVPESLALPTAIAACALLGFAAWRRKLGVRRVVLGASACLVTVVAAAAVAYAIVSIVVVLRDAHEPWAAHPLPLRIALAGGALAVALAAARLPLAQRAGFEGVFFGGWSALACAGIALAATIPSASYLAVIPTAVAALCALAYALVPDAVRERRRSALELGPLVPLAAFWMPLGIGVEQSFGFDIAAAIGAVWGVLGAAVLPSLSRAPRPSARAALSGAIALSLGALCAALAVPAYSADEPQPLNLVHVQDGASGAAAWRASANDTRVFELAELGELRDAPPEHWLASAQPAGAFRAPRWDVAAPELTVIESSATATGRRVRARLASARGARMIGIELPSGTRLASASWGDVVRNDVAPNRPWCIFAAFANEPIELALECTGSAPIGVRIFDADGSLPPQAAPLLAERPPDRVPRSHGDGSIVCGRAEL